MEVASLKAFSNIGKYLGLPSIVDKSRNKAFKGLVERAGKKPCDWKYKFLSQAGKEILIKVVV